MEAVAITDHGNMFGVAEFLKCANDKSNKNPDKSYKVKPILTRKSRKAIITSFSWQRTTRATKTL